MPERKHNLPASYDRLDGQIVGEPSPCVLCMGPGCWERSTSKHGLRQLPLCPACAAALRGEVYQREAPPERSPHHAPRRSLTRHH